MNTPRRAFTLIELLVVVAIIALLISILLPSLGRVKQKGIATRCLANLKSIGLGLVNYQTENDNYVIPSYNMTGDGSSAQTCDGWCAILDRDGDCSGYKGITNNVFCCPNTIDEFGMAGGQTASDLSKPKGWQDYPTHFLGAGDSGGQADPTLPDPTLGPSYIHEIRCSYFLNANNPTGSTSAFALPCPYYTQSVGYVGSNGTMANVKAGNFVRPAALIVALDGVYAGRQSVSRLGETNSRIGYRHLGPTITFNVGTTGTTMTTEYSTSNVAFADGHAEPVSSNKMPHGNVTAENNGPYSFLAAQ